MSNLIDTNQTFTYGGYKYVCTAIKQTVCTKSRQAKYYFNVYNPYNECFVHRHDMSEWYLRTKVLPHVTNLYPPKISLDEDLFIV